MEDSAHDLVPLSLAARTLYQRVYEELHRRTGQACGAEQLNGIAYTIGALLPLFTHGKEPDSIRRLSDDETRKGLFRDGASTLIFLDGRPAIGRLAVSASGVERVARMLAGQSIPPL